jgi:hypothetical protein
MMTGCLKVVVEPIKSNKGWKRSVASQDPNQLRAAGSYFDVCLKSSRLDSTSLTVPCAKESLYFVLLSRDF